MHWTTANDSDVSPEDKDALNMQLEGDGTFFVSYIADLKAAEDKFGIKVPSGNKEDETALVQRGTNILGLNKYFTLPGDHRKAYEEIIGQGFNACYRYYLRQRKEVDEH